VKLFLFHTPEEVPNQGLPDCAIAIDVLRATTTMAAALAAGAEAIQVFSDIDTLLTVSETWPLDKRLRAGERGGGKVEGCDLGNSPLDHSAERSGGKRLFMSTTNGTRCLKRIEQAPLVITAALEDTVCAGAVIHGVMAATGQSFKDLAGNDAAIASVSLYLQWQDQLLDLLHYASHGQRLLGLDNEADLKYCAQLDVLPVVPRQREAGVLAL
jgi:2-phosphosulfolactate phosphatase